MRFVYTIIYLIFLPFLKRKIKQRVAKTQGAQLDFLQYYGHYSQAKRANIIWLHTVSLGESITAQPLIKGILQVFPEHTLLVTNSTASGYVYMQKHLHERILSAYLPFDVPVYLKRFFEHFQPSMGIILETELWPNLLAVCSQRNLPLLLANARMSERSYRGYDRVKWLVKPMLQSFTMLAAQSQADADRFIKLGLPADRAQVVGNLKFELRIPEGTEQAAHVLRQQWGSRPVLVVGSTHEGEETIILAAWKVIKEACPGALLVLAPRHSERFDEVATLCLAQNFHLARVSKDEQATEQTDILLGDVMGKLLSFYAAGNVGFVGGSLTPVGGHNLLEPAAFKKPVLTGPHLHNFIAIRDLLVSKNALTIVNNAEQLAQQVQQLFADHALAEKLGNAAYQVVQENQGATQKHVELLSRLNEHTNTQTHG